MAACGCARSDSVSSAYAWRRKSGKRFAGRQRQSRRLGLAGSLGLIASQLELTLAQEWECHHCDTGEAFTEFLQPSPSPAPGKCSSEVHNLWPAHVEVIPLTSDVGGPEPPSFHERLAKEAINGWKMFANEVVPGLKKGHFLTNFLSEAHAGALNDGFFHWQKNLFEAFGDMEKAVEERHAPVPTPDPAANSSWPSMQALPEYRRLRQIVEKLSRRYLIRSGVSQQEVDALEYSVFNWAAINRPGEFHGPHTHVGEYHVGVFYAQVGPDAGKLRFGDPRGHIPPFGNTYLHTPRSGDLVFFPSWLSHMATVTAPATATELRGLDHEEPYRVIFSFNIGPLYGPLPCHFWFSDPTGDMRFMRRTQVDPRELGLLDEDDSENHSRAS